MKKTFKYLSIVTICTLSHSVLSGGAFAVDLPAPTTLRSNDLNTRISDKTQEMCKKFASSRLSSKLEENKGSLEQKLEGQRSGLDEKRSEWDEKRNKERQEADAKRQEHYDRLIAAATDDNQKAAVAEFQESVENAVAVRRTAQDTARNEYRKGVDAAFGDKKNTITGASSSLKADIDAAIAKATLSCENGAPPEEVMKTLKADLQAARLTFKGNTKIDENLSKTLKELSDKRKAAIEEAKAEFQKSLDDARAKLKNALGQ